MSRWAGGQVGKWAGGQVSTRLEQESRKTLSNLMLVLTIHKKTMRRSVRFVQSLLLLGISLSAITLWSTKPSPAQTRLLNNPSETPLELSILEPGAPPKDGVITADTISQTNLTIPSLWWAKEQFGNKVLDNWLAYPTDGKNAARVDLVVNQQNWSLLDYLERYEFVNQFGSVARDYGYNVRVFNHQKELLATYTCDFSNKPQLCSIEKLDATGKAGLRGSR